MITIDIHKQLAGPEGSMELSLDLSITSGKLISLFGESGSGKTSTLRMLAGLMKPDSGSIQVGGEVWFDSEKKINVKTRDRKIGYVFQDYALFPHLTVLRNLEFAAQTKHNKARVEELITIFELDALQHRKPETLSGGQQQRVALARALVLKPKILLLDEPLSALDAKIRWKLQDYIAQVHKEYGLTTILVSHDLGEIHRLSHWVVELSNGKIVRQGTPSELFTGGAISGKFRFTGEVLAIEEQDVVFVVSVLIHNEVIKVIAQKNEIGDLQPGNKVVVASKAFNPVIYKV